MYWLQGDGTGHVLFNLLKSLLLLKGPCKIIILLHHLMKVAYNEATVLEHAFFKNPLHTERIMFLTSEQRNSSNLLITSVGM